MQSAKDIKRRKKSISNIGQIAKAMEVVSATKMRRSQRIALDTRPYVRSAMEVLKTVSQKTDPEESYFFGRNALNAQYPTIEATKKIAVLLISTDKGLCGGLNTNVFRKTEELLMWLSDSAENNSSEKSPRIDFITVGKKANEWCKRKNFNMIKSFLNFGDYAIFEETTPLSEFIIALFREKHDAVYAVYTNFLSALQQEAIYRQILPLKEERLKEIIAGIVPTYGRFAGDGSPISNLEAEFPPNFKWNFEYKFEPNIKIVLEHLLQTFVQIMIYYIILESNASEHSARRMAMKNARDNAENILKELNLSYNKARQAAITQEISEIARGL